MTTYDEIVKRYRACESMKQVARELKINHSVVRRVLITEGILSDDRIDMAVQMREEGRRSKKSPRRCM